MSKKKNNFIDSIAPNAFQVLVLILAVAAAFYIGKLTTKVEFYEDKAVAGNNPNAVNPSDANDPQLPTQEDFESLVLFEEGDHVRGSTDAKIAIIEYSDFDCPFCGTFHETAKQIVEESNGEVMWIYRHFPLDGLHPEARDKAVASECAAAVGGNDAFWAFADELFETGATYDQISTVAQNIGLDVSSFESCLNEEAPKLAVEYDEQTAMEVGVQGTPGNYVVNLETEFVMPLYGAEPIDNVRDAIEDTKVSPK